MHIHCVRLFLAMRQVWPLCTDRCSACAGSNSARLDCLVPIASTNMAHAGRPEVEMLNYRFVCLVALFAITACGEAQQTQRQQFKESAAEPTTQPAQAKIADFDGNWVGSGSNARAAFRNRCGSGPLVELTIQDGAAKAVFRFTIRRGIIRSEVLTLSGAIDDHGRLEISDFQSDAMAVLSARDGSGDGTWEARGLACHGTFRVRRRP